MAKATKSRKNLVNSRPGFGRKGIPTETGRDDGMAVKAGTIGALTRGGDRKTQDFHMKRAGDHLVMALGKRLAERDKK